MAVRSCAVDPRWCLVHATHMTEDGNGAARRNRCRGRTVPDDGSQSRRWSISVACLPRCGGVIGIGSEAHISVSPVEECAGSNTASAWLRVIAISWLGFQRKRRCDLVGRCPVWRRAGFGTRDRCDRSRRFDAAGSRSTRGSAAARPRSTLAGCPRYGFPLDTFLFAGNVNLVRHVMVRRLGRARFPSSRRRTDRCALSGNSDALAHRGLARSAFAWRRLGVMNRRRQTLNFPSVFP